MKNTIIAILAFFAISSVLAQGNHFTTLQTVTANDINTGDSDLDQLIRDELSEFSVSYNVYWDGFGGVMISGGQNEDIITYTYNASFEFYLGVGVSTDFEASLVVEVVPVADGVGLVVLKWTISARNGGNTRTKRGVTTLGRVEQDNSNQLMPADAPVSERSSDPNEEPSIKFEIPWGRVNPPTNTAVGQRIFTVDTWKEFETGGGVLTLKTFVVECVYTLFEGGPGDQEEV